MTDGASSPSSVASPTTVPFLRLSRPSQTSGDSEILAFASTDADFARLAKARCVYMMAIGVLNSLPLSVMGMYCVN